MKTKSPVRYSMVIQFSVCLLLSLLALIFGWVQAYSLCLGALIFIGPNLYFTYYAFRFRGAEWAVWIRRSFLRGEMGKLSLAAVSFALVFRFISPLDFKALFGGFIAMIALQWRLAYKLSCNTAEAECVNHSGK